MISNAPDRYGSVTKTFHWATVLFIATLIPTGIIANGMPFETSEELASKAWLFSIHKTVGVALFFTALLRILWALSQTKPAPLHPERRLESGLAEVVHWLLYGSLIIVPLSGWVHHASTEGFAPIWWPFGQNLPFVPKSESLATLTAGLHIVFERVLVASLFLHIAGALKHHLFDRDDTLRRMWFGQTAAGGEAVRSSHVMPFGGAVAVWIAALGIGSAVGAFDSHDPKIASVDLAEVASDWAVQDGTLGITVVQLGAPVSGSFTEWTAAISFDEAAEGQVLGNVDVTVAIPSLTLGSVTGQALGTDYLDGTGFPTANFVADIQRNGAAYVAVGTLTLRGVEMPLQLPFNLSIDGDTATMDGALTLDRRDFGIGDGMTDEASLAFAVDIDVALTASRE